MKKILHDFSAFHFINARSKGTSGGPLAEINIEVSNISTCYRVRTLFQKHISRTFPRRFQDSDFSRALKFTLTPTLQGLYVNSPYCLPHTSYFLVEFNRFPELFKTSGLLPGLESAGKCHKKIPELSRSCMNPVVICYITLFLLLHRHLLAPDFPLSSTL